jgi:hypothetical protein
MVTVSVCTANRPCDAEAAATAPAGALQMNLTTAITDADAKAIFSPLSGIKILHFTSMLDVFSGFAQKVDEERFHRRVKDYAGIWCCIHAHPVRRTRLGAACAATPNVLTPARFVSGIAGTHLVRPALRQAARRQAQPPLQRHVLSAAHGAVMRACSVLTILDIQTKNSLCSWCGEDLPPHRGQTRLAACQQRQQHTWLHAP